MRCLQNILCGDRTIIGVRDYDECTQPESGLYIGDIPGISIKVASKITSEELHTGANLMRRSINIATKLVFDEFAQSIAPYFDFNAVVETRQLDRFSEDCIYPQANLDRGLILKRWRSELAKIYIEEIYIKVDVDAYATEVKIIDGQLTKSFFINLKAGVVYTLYANYIAESEQVKILVNNELLGTYCCDTLYNRQGFDGCGTCRSGKGFFITGWNGTDEESKCFGVGVKASVRCYEENVICSLIPRMYFLLWYRSGIEFLNEYINSDRLNNVTLFTKERAIILRAELSVDYAGRSEAFVKSIYHFLKSTKGECITCNGNKYVQQHP